MHVGQTVYLRPIGNTSRRSTEIKSGIVSNIGNKYFYIDGWGSTRFHKDTLIKDGRGYPPDWKVYLSEQAIKDEDEHRELIRCFRELFGAFGSGPKLSLNQLREMYKIATQSQSCSDQKSTKEGW